MVEGFLYEFGLGFLCLGLALLLPYRKMSNKIEFGWDVLSYVAVFIFVTIYEGYIEYFFEHALSFIPFVESLQNFFISSVAPVLILIVYIMLADFFAYWAHRILHWKWLWNHHAWHHAPKYIYFGSGLRGAFIHTVILFSTYTLAAFLVPIFEFEHAIFYLFIFDSLNQHYLHSNIYIPGARFIEFIFVTPRMHLVHHVANPKRTNTNYGFVFSVWDRMFDTFTNPDLVSKDEELGLDYDATNWKMLLGLPARK